PRARGGLALCQCSVGSPLHVPRRRSLPKLAAPARLGARANRVRRDLSTEIDTHANGGSLLNRKGVIVGGHAEYWSKEMFDAFEAARGAGVNSAFFGADTTSVHVRVAASAAGVADRVIVCYKDASIDPVQGPTPTTAWRYPPVNL